MDYTTFSRNYKWQILGLTREVGNLLFKELQIQPHVEDTGRQTSNLSISDSNPPAPRRGTSESAVSVTRQSSLSPDESVSVPRVSPALTGAFTLSGKSTLRERFAASERGSRT